eukprot:UN05388
MIITGDFTQRLICADHHGNPCVLPCPDEKTAKSLLSDGIVRQTNGAVFPVSDNDLCRDEILIQKRIAVYNITLSNLKKFHKLDKVLEQFNDSELPLVKLLYEAIFN